MVKSIGKGVYVDHFQNLAGVLTLEVEIALLSGGVADSDVVDDNRDVVVLGLVSEVLVENFPILIT